MNFNFGNNLKRLRLAKNYTQEQAAEKLNVSSKAISRWECGNAMPDVMLLPEIARLYCVTVDELYKEKKRNATCEKTIQGNTEEDLKAQQIALTLLDRLDEALDE